MKIHPQYVYRDGDQRKTIRHVSEFRDHKTRPPVRCPKCNEKVIMALGEVNVDHYRHRPDSCCALRGSKESIMHSNVKYRIAGQLAEGDTLLIEQGCVRHSKRGCGSVTATPLFSGWGQSAVEYGIGDYFADVAVDLDGQCMGVIEVHVKHKTVGDKAGFLTATVPWAEVSITDENYDDIMDWTVGEVIAAETVSYSTLSDWKCPECATLDEKERVEKEKREAREAAIQAKVDELEGLPSVVRCLGIRDIDFVFRSGKTYRKYLCLYADYRGDVILRTWMQFKNRDEKLYEKTLPNDLQHVKNYYRKVISGNFRMVDMSTEIYSNRAVGYHIHDARRENSPPPGRFNFT
ncbi:competence protein CoiA family protein [Mariprofundus ferrooxydans]|uniref:competence protein CoiA family protein n=1 Tax=Mariprofundus ferrooxydans TaxID=314344 RepID=UPI0014314440|nr:competence protein CoiA family protein [Mariprofundus ferrooxydans]